MTSRKHTWINEEINKLQHLHCVIDSEDDSTQQIPRKRKDGRAIRENLKDKRFPGCLVDKSTEMCTLTDNLNSFEVAQKFSTLKLMLVM